MFTRLELNRGPAHMQWINEYFYHVIKINCYMQQRFVMKLSYKKSGDSCICCSHSSDWPYSGFPFYLPGVFLGAVSCLTSFPIYSGSLSCYQCLIGSQGTADILKGAVPEQPYTLKHTGPSFVISKADLLWLVVANCKCMNKYHKSSHLTKLVCKSNQ